MPPRVTLAVGGAVGDRDRPARRDAERAASLPRPEEQGARSCASSARATGKPQHRPALPGRPGSRRPAWDGQRERGPQRTEPAPEGDYAFTVAVRDKAGNLTEAPQPVPRAPAARPGTGVSVRRVHPARPALGGHRRRVRAPRGRAGGPQLRLRRVPPRRPEAVLHGGRVAGRFRIRDPEQDADRRLRRPRAGGEQRAVWPLAVAGLPPRSAPWRGAPAGRAARAHLAGPEPRGRRRRRLRRTGFRSRDAVRLDRPFAGGGLPPRFDAGGVAAPALARPRAARPTTSPRTSRSPAARGRRSGTRPGWPSPEASCGCRSELMERLRDYVADGGRVASVRRGLLQARGELRGDRRAQPVAAAARERVRRADRAPAHERGAADRVRGRARAVRGRVRASSASSRSSRPPAACRARPRRITEAGRDAGQPAFLAFGLGGGIVLRAGTPQWARELEESALSLELPQVTKRIWRMLSRRTRLSRLPSCAP